MFGINYLFKKVVLCYRLKFIYCVDLRKYKNKLLIIPQKL